MTAVLQLSPSDFAVAGRVGLVIPPELLLRQEHGMGHDSTTSAPLLGTLASTATSFRDSSQALILDDSRRFTLPGVTSLTGRRVCDFELVWGLRLLPSSWLG